MKKPLFIIFNDVHLKAGNEEETLLSVRHLIEYANLNKIKKVFFLGDLFHSRSNQKESVLQACDEIFLLFFRAGIELIVFPGNHDKTSYFSHSSFLDVYRFHPGVIFTDKLLELEVGGKSITLLPFFDDSMLVPMLEEAKGGDLLLSHFEMNGSSHLGQVSDKSSITRATLKKWKKTYLGHYHNTHEITPDIVHLPSLRQQDFGEDNNKGFSVIYDDLSYSIVKGVFKEFYKITIDIGTTDSEGIKELITAYKNSSNSVRFELVGENSKLKALDKSQFSDTGIDIKLKYEKNFDKEDFIAPQLIKKFDMGQVIATFRDFCTEKNLNHEVGFEYLTKFLNKQK